MYYSIYNDVVKDALDKETSIYEITAKIRNELVMPLVLLEGCSSDGNSKEEEFKEAVDCIRRIGNLLSQINNLVKSH